MGTTHLTAEQRNDVQLLRDSGALAEQIWERLAQQDIYTEMVNIL